MVQLKERTDFKGKPIHSTFYALIVEESHKPASAADCGASALLLNGAEKGKTAPSRRPVLSITPETVGKMSKWTRKALKLQNLARARGGGRATGLILDASAPCHLRPGELGGIAVYSRLNARHSSVKSLPRLPECSDMYWHGASLGVRTARLPRCLSRALNHDIAAESPVLFSVIAHSFHAESILPHTP